MSRHDDHGEEHHPVRDALAAAGDIYADALTSILGEHHPEPWEQALEQYEHDHPRATT